MTGKNTPTRKYAQTMQNQNASATCPENAIAKRVFAKNARILATKMLRKWLVVACHFHMFMALEYSFFVALSPYFAK